MGDRQFWPLDLALVRHDFYQAVEKGTNSEPTVTLTGTLKRMRVNLLVNEITNLSCLAVLPW
jgi:hypothetical protein